MRRKRFWLALSPIYLSLLILASWVGIKVAHWQVPPGSVENELRPWPVGTQFEGSDLKSAAPVSVRDRQIFFAEDPYALRDAHFIRAVGGDLQPFFERKGVQIFEDRDAVIELIGYDADLVRIALQKSGGGPRIEGYILVETLPTR